MIDNWENYYRKKIETNGIDAYYKYKIAKHQVLLSIVEELYKKSLKPTINTGLGAGLFPVYFAQKGLISHGLDNNMGILKLSISVAKHFNVQTTYYLGDIKETGVSDKSYSVSYNFGVMEHFSNSSISTIIFEQIRIADYFVFAIPSINTGANRLDYFGNERYLTAKDWENIISSSGVKIMSKHGYDFSSNREKRAINTWDYSKANFFIYVLSSEFQKG